MKRNTFASAAFATRIALSLLVGLFWLLDAGTSRAQFVPAQHNSAVLASDVAESLAAPAPTILDQPLIADGELSSPRLESTSAPAAPASPQVGEPASDWHFSVSPYLWFPGVHGTVGSHDELASVHASAGDLLSQFRFGLMGLFDTRYKRIVIPIDMMWIRLGDSRAFPIEEEADSAELKASEFILTPKVGYRVIDTKMIKVDALAGFRYWHFGQSLHVTADGETDRFTASRNWVDPLVGGRILASLSPKVEVSIGGDVGGWGTGSQLDYQFGALLGYRIKPAVVLQAGYRYLFVDYRSGGSVINLVTSGVIFGATFTLK